MARRAGLGLHPASGRQAPVRPRVAPIPECSSPVGKPGHHEAVSQGTSAAGDRDPATTGRAHHHSRCLPNKKSEGGCFQGRCDSQ